MTDDTSKAQEERARRLRQTIDEMRKRAEKGLEPAPKTPRDFVDPARRGDTTDRGDESSES